MKTGLISKLINMKTTIILSLITFTLITGYKATAQTLGNACGSTSNPLTMDWEIPLGGYNFNFTENSATPSLVNIGFPLCTPTTPIARLNVLNDALQAAGYFLTRFNSSSSVVGVAGDASNSAGNAVGVHGEAIAPGGTYNAIGVNGQSTEVTNDDKIVNILKGLKPDMNADSLAEMHKALAGDQDARRCESVSYTVLAVRAGGVNINHSIRMQKIGPDTKLSKK